MTSLWWQNKKRSPEITLWLVNYILQLIALLFITFRGIIPDLFSIVLANLFIIGGTVAEKVLQLVSQPIIFEGQKAVVSTSIGIALFPDHSEDMDKLIKLADEAMYKVKNSGKNGFRFVNIMTE
jgi:predicted signal transduction protein with EAL and GGDEF domain